MTRHDFDALVKEIEGRYASRQAALERSISAWVAFGLTGVVSWLALLFLMGAAAFASGMFLEAPLSIILLVVGVLLLVYGASQAGLFLLTEIAPPAGRLLKPGEAPALNNLLEGLQRKLGCRPFDEVRVSLDFNASVREFPRLGVLGWPRTVLEIGLPLSTTLTPDELRAVLAHEFVHLSARHGRSGNRLYRLHRTWETLLKKIQRPGAGKSNSIVSKFVEWYWPRLHARSQVLSRLQEFQADRIAAGLCGAATLASALWRMECLWPWLSERFWVDLYREAEHSAEPPDDVLARLRTALEIPPSAVESALWTDRGLSRATDVNDSHPSFPARAQALGLPLADFRASGFPKAPHPSAAEAFLGPDLERIEQELASDWRRMNQAAWRERHRREAAGRRRRKPHDLREAGTEIASTSPKESTAPQDVSSLWETARETIDRRGIAPAVTRLRAILAQNAEHAGASVVLGQHLLGVGDSEGERWLLGVIDRADEQWMTRACNVLEDHYRTTGQTDRLQAIRARLDRYDSEILLAQRERSTIHPGDRFLPHGLTVDALSSLREVASSEPDCVAVWLVRKDLQYFLNRPLFILCLAGTPSTWGFARPDLESALVRRFIPRVQLPGQVLVIARSGKSRKLARSVVSCPGSQVDLAGNSMTDDR